MHKNDRIMIFSGVGVTILAIVLALIMGTWTVVESEPAPEPPKEPNIVAASPITQSGTSEQGTNQVITVPLSNPVNVTVTLTWTDEPDGTGCPPPAFRWINQPDNFGLEITSPDGNTTGNAPPMANPQGGQGTVTLSVTVAINGTNWAQGNGAWEITVVCGDCGDQVKRRPGVFGWVDPGNDWEMTIEYSGYEIAEEGA